MASYIDLLILTRLAQGQAHGYEINKHVRRVLGSSLNGNLLYPALRRFEEHGLIDPVGEQLGDGPRQRKVYELTDEGRTHLQATLESGDPALATHNEEFRTRVAFFHLVPPVVRRQLLAARRDHLRRERAHLTMMRADSTGLYWATRVVDFQISGLDSELVWISQLEEVVERSDVDTRDFQVATGQGDGRL